MATQRSAHALANELLPLPRPQTLAEELFPPSPPGAAVNPVSDSEGELSSPPVRAVVSSAEPNPRRRKGRTSLSTFTLSSSSDSDAAPTRTSSISTTNKTGAKGRARRRITIEVDPSSSSSSSDCEIIDPPAVRTPRRRVAPSPLPPAARPQASSSDVDCICICSSDEDAPFHDSLLPPNEQPSQQLLPSTVMSREPDETEHNPNFGILSWEPTPRSARTKLLRKEVQHEGWSESPSDVGSKGVRRIVDLALDSDAEEDGLKPLSFVPVSKPRARPLKLGAPQPRKKPSPLPAALRESLSLSIIKELDRAVFRHVWKGMTRLEPSPLLGLPTDIAVHWNSRLLKTAGQATWRKATPGREGVCKIDLSIKVLDTVEKLRATLAHELVHLATWILSCEMKPSHGAGFKLWHVLDSSRTDWTERASRAARVHQCIPDIVVTTKHSYEISYKFHWRCLACPRTFSRHSNSIDVTKAGCPCGSPLIAIDADGNIKLPRTPAKRSAWDDYRDIKSKEIRLESPGIASTEVFKLVATRWKEHKQLLVDSDSLLAQGLEGVQLW